MLSNVEPVKTIKIQGSRDTLKIMKRLINLASKNMYVRKWAVYIIGGTSACCDYEKADNVLEFVQDNVRYVKDPHKYEMIQTPVNLLQAIDKGERPAGDCDCMTTLTLSLCESIGIPTKIIAAGYKPDRKLSHVYGAVRIKNKWYPVEPIKSEAPVGFAFPGPTKIITEVV